MNLRGMALVVLLLFVLAPMSVQAASVPPAPEDDGVWVIDAANVLSSSEFDSLNALCNHLYLETGRPILVLTIESFASQYADGWGEEKYANFAFGEYGIIDDAGQDKAILVFMSEDDRRFWTELGGGYAGENRDDYVQSVFDNEVRPFLGEDRWFDGLNAAVEGLRPILEEGEITIPDFDWSDEIWVVDDGNILSNDEETELNLIINEIELETSCPIIILTINSLGEKNASMLSFDSYIDKVFDEYGVQDCGIIWGIMKEINLDPWSDIDWYQITVSSGEQYNGDWDRYLRDQPWKMQDSLYYGQEYGMNEGSSLFEVTIDITQYSEKAINDDGFEIKEWLKINLMPILLSSTLLFFGIGLFVYSLPNKFKFRRRKEEAFENTAIINRAIMSNLAGDSNARREWNGVFRNMKDSEIKSFRKLDKKLKTEQVNIGLEKYEMELKTIKEIYNLQNTRSDYVTIFSIIISFPIVIMLALSYSDSSIWMMEAQGVNIDDIMIAIFAMVFIGFLAFGVGAFFIPATGILFGAKPLEIGQKMTPEQCIS